MLIVVAWILWRFKRNIFGSVQVELDLIYGIVYHRKQFQLIYSTVQMFGICKKFFF